MINAKKLSDIAKRWRAAAAMGGRNKRMSSSAGAREGDACRCSATTTVADKGHFTLYTSEGRRFMVPLAFLKTGVFEELLRMAEEEFGLPRDGPITLPCSAPFLEHVLSSLRRSESGAEKDQVMASNCMRHCLRSSHGDADAGQGRGLLVF